jgi:hypothetical protein
LEQEVAQALGVEGETNSIRLTQQRMALLEAGHPEAYRSALELKTEREALEKFLDTAEKATIQVERRHLWEEGQLVRSCDERERLAMQTVIAWPQMCEAHAVAFSLSRPDLSQERKVLLSEARALREVVLDAGAPHLLTNSNWRQQFEAVCSTCEQPTPLTRKLRCMTAGCGGGEWSYCACENDLDHVASAAGKCVWRDLYGLWRAMGGDEHTGG